MFISCHVVIAPKMVKSEQFSQNSSTTVDVENKNRLRQNYHNLLGTIKSII